MYKVTSEIYGETDYSSIKGDNGRVLSKFKFKYPTEDENVVIQNDTLVDKDGDLIVKRKGASTRDGVITIEHSEATELRLVGLQVWRGALLLADYIFHKRNEFRDKFILELGAGVGLTSIAAALYAQQVVCTDVNVGGILDLIRENVKHNSNLVKNNNIDVLELDFLKPIQEYSAALLKAIDDCDIVVAADVIYDDDLTNAFIRIIDVFFERGRLSGKNKTVLIALEKRYVFTLTDLDTTAPMFEYFLKQTINKPWVFEYIETNSFPQYFEYDRSRHLVLIKVTQGK
ncbi:methyltransferase-like protein 22 [Zeugodacus cucurbitae]|uniref:methyltransferase-like protein 22 n=1 Tax=Zeugodacus cucurbitae TaxID=28588 RepID=UPI0023D9151C|nr:methyltransferase-like protein 22 [Zeugodacus cucurbitae]